MLNKMNTLSARDKMVKNRTQLLLRYPFFGYLALGLKLVEDPSVKRMATDGENIFYNPSFVTRLRPKFLKTIIAHEVLHCGLGHIWRRGERQPEKWNYAVDYAANLLLKKEGFAMPTNILLDDKFDDMEAETIYTKLPNTKPNEKMMNSHDKWGKEKKDKANSGNGQNSLEKIWQDRAVRAAAAARLQGKLSGTIEDLIQGLLMPQLDWKLILRDLITMLARNDFRLIPPVKKHLWRGIYLPSIYGEYLEIAIAVDTSGSISKLEFLEFITEIKGITEQFTDYLIHIYFCDVEIHHKMTLTPYESWPEEFPKKGGGTSFVPVFNDIDLENHGISALVYLTDGAGTYPEYQPDYPVIWVVNTDYQVPWGEYIKLEAAYGNN
jgi:predicted metal-dependent peptidase